MTTQTSIAPLWLNGREWRHKTDPDCGMKDGGQWVQKVIHHFGNIPTGNVQYLGASSPHPETELDACHMIEYLHRLSIAVRAK
jgi:hypothetical protein